MDFVHPQVISLQGLGLGVPLLKVPVGNEAAGRALSASLKSHLEASGCKSTTLISQARSIYIYTHL